VLEYPLLLVFPVAMAYAAVSDLLTLTIPNRISIALVAAFFGAALTSNMPWSELASHVAAAVAVLLVTIFLFSRGFLGGGDAKLLAASALWIGFDMLGPYLVMVSIMGGVLAIAILTYRKMIPPLWISRPAWAVRLHDAKCGIPYGIALAMAGLWLYPKTPWFAALSG
jgi:prepilin peptidase CpaA